MTAKERRKVKHTLKTKIDSADIWLKLAIDVANEAGVTSEELKSYSSTATIVSELEKVKKEISENYSKFMSEIDNLLASLK